MRGARQWWQAPRRAERARNKVGINKEKETRQRHRRAPAAGVSCRRIQSVETMDHTIPPEGGGSIRSR